METTGEKRVVLVRVEKVGWRSILRVDVRVRSLISHGLRPSLVRIILTILTSEGIVIMPLLRLISAILAIVGPGLHLATGR